MDFEKEIKELLDRLKELLKTKNFNEAKKIIEESLDGFNEQIKERIEKELESFDVLPPDILKGLELSKVLYQNAQELEGAMVSILKEHIEKKSTINELAKKLYEGYDFKEKEILEVKKRLPKYLLKELNRPLKSKKLLKRVNRLKTLPLRAAYTKIVDALEKEDQDALKKALFVATEEKARFYATRIAQTEIFRAKNFKWAKEYIEDDEIAFVKFEMSSHHPKVDICDFYAHLDIGYGKGVVPKEQMRTLPLHPFCLCKYVPVYKDRKLKGKKEKDFKSAARETMRRFSEYEQRHIVGSREKLEEFKRGSDIEELFNRLRPRYPIRRYVEVLYNTPMDRFRVKYKKNDFGYIVGSISTELARILSSVDKKVIFSDESLKKNLKHHSDLTEEDYLKLDSIIGKSHFVAKDGERTIAISLYAEDMYHYALKATKSGKAIFLTSFRKTKIKDIERLRKKGKKGKIKIIKDFMP